MSHFGGAVQKIVLEMQFIYDPRGRLEAGTDGIIELRDPKELLNFQGKKVYVGNVKGFYPGFDVVPHELITESIAIHAGA